MRRGTRTRLRTLGRMQAIVVVVAVAIPLVTAERARDLPPPIGVTVHHAVAYVEPGTTFGDVVRRFHLRARSGSFLSVTGEVIRSGAYPGRILLDGKEAADDQRLAEGDVVKVVNGADRTEPTERDVVPLPEPVQGNPQFTLGTTPGEQIELRGKVSGEVVSSTFHATGPTDTPNAVALTFDDGPSPLYTPRILSILQHFHVQATFFGIGFEIAAHPELIQQEEAAGMTVGNHSWDHPTNPPFRDLPPTRMRAEMSKVVTVLQTVGVTPFLFRPPGGTYSEALIGMADSMGMRVVLWSVDPQDWRNDITPKEIVSNVLGNVHAGSIVILHDGGGFQDATVAALPKIIKGIRKMGLGLVPLTP